MIKQELRIGNYIDSSLGIIKIDSLPDDYNYELFMPIQLTEEILLKCGFKGIALPLYLNTGYFEFVWRKELFLDVEGQWLPIKCDYLHQLQNLYFALTGTELEVNL